jgi:hypothetical protein
MAVQVVPMPLVPRHGVDHDLGDARARPVGHQHDPVGQQGGGAAEQGRRVERSLEHREASSRLGAGGPGGPKGKRCASLSRRAKIADNPVLGAMAAQFFSKFSRLVLRNRRIRILTLGIKFMESLTLSPFYTGISYCAGSHPLAGYS